MQPVIAQVEHAPRLVEHENRGEGGAPIRTQPVVGEREARCIQMVEYARDRRRAERLAGLHVRLQLPRAGVAARLGDAPQAAQGVCEH